MRITPLWNHVSVQNGYAFSADEFSSSGDMPLVRIRDIQGKSFETFISREAIPSDDFVIRDGDLVVGMDGDFNSTIWDRGEAALNQRVCIVRSKDATDIRFIHYAMAEPLKVVNNLRYSTTVKHLSQDDIYSMRLLLPSSEEQQRIADYLDRETAEIDAAVADLDRYVELLEKRRQVMIAQSVRGIGSNRTRVHPCTLPGGEGMSNLQDSGAYWLGEIPKDWTMLPAWALFAEGKEKCLSDDPHLVPSRVYGVVTRDRLAELSGNKPVDNEASAHHMKHVEPHNFIISMGSHESGIEHSRLVGKVSNDYRVLLPTSGVNPEYYKWFFKSEPLIEGLRGLTTEIRVGQRIHYSRFSLLRLPLPPAEDQQRIADYLDRETAEIDSLIADSTRLRDLLLKRRSVLITEVVTGRKRV